MSAEIKLTGKKGDRLVVIIDDEDIVKVCGYKWHLNAYGYATYKYNQTFILMHRLIIGAKVGQEVDHLNRNRLDNRKCNLRICTRTENCQNKVKTKGSSKFYGVYWNKQTKSWRTRIAKAGKVFEGGLFKIEKEAAKKYDELALKHYGNNARLNFKLGGQH